MKYVDDNITNAPEMYIIHGCNAQGVMGSGVAKDIRAKWPGAYIEYRDEYEENGLVVGTAVIHHYSSLKNWQHNKIIGNLITQEFYGRAKGKQYADPKAISDAIMHYIATVMVDRAIDPKDVEIATSKIGCGLGGLKWKGEMEEIFLLIEKHFGVNFVVYDCVPA